MSLFSSDVPVAGPYAPSCSSRTADGALRGVLVGWCWTAAFRDDASPALHDGRAVAKPPSLARVTLKNSAGFAAFLGAFAAATCFCERTRRADDAWNKVFGGAVAFEDPTDDEETTGSNLACAPAEIIVDYTTATDLCGQYVTSYFDLCDHTPGFCEDKIATDNPYVNWTSVNQCAGCSCSTWPRVGWK